jgi:transposase
VNKRFRACSLDQQFLLPPSLQDWLPEDHLARFVADVMNEFDLSAIYAKYERTDGRGLSAYHPLLVTRVLLYGAFASDGTGTLRTSKHPDSTSPVWKL